MKEVLFFSTGNTAVLEDGQQVPELQESWLLLFVKFLEEKGLDPTKFNYHLYAGDAEVFKIPGGYNWRIKKCTIDQNF